jgi:hypothetical protein
MERERQIERGRERERKKEGLRERIHTSTNTPGLTSLSILRSLMAASSWTPMAKKSAALAGYSPWKFPAEIISPRSENTI